MATPPLVAFVFIKRERPTRKKFSGHLHRMLNWVSITITMSFSWNNVTTSFAKNLFRTALMFQKQILTGLVKTRMLLFTIKKDSYQLTRRQLRCAL